MPERSPNCLAKLERMNRALRHQEADRVPVSDFFWGSFLRRWREELGLAPDTDIYRYYDLDWMVTVPNMDPRIREFEILEQDASQVVVRTGFGAVIRKKFDQAMPAFLGFETDTLEKLEAFRFDDAWDERRWFRAGDNQLAGVGDGFERNSPAWIETVRSRRTEIPVYGSVCEAQEMLWRIVGSENVLVWIGEHPDRLGRSIDRVGRYCLELAEAQIQAAGGQLDGMVISIVQCKMILKRSRTVPRSEVGKGCSDAPSSPSHLTPGRSHRGRPVGASHHRFHYRLISSTDARAIFSAG